MPASASRRVKYFCAVMVQSWPYNNHRLYIAWMSKKYRLLFSYESHNDLSRFMTSSPISTLLEHLVESELGYTRVENISALSKILKGSDRWIRVFTTIVHLISRLGMYFTMEILLQIAALTSVPDQTALRSVSQQLKWVIEPLWFAANPITLDLSRRQTSFWLNSERWQQGTPGSLILVEGS
ncbi:hypothetical protein B0H13DRAFT_1908195 [Mycena leptocephala]|nr:hypothetical protein B0H13DRAFT_1908195 [Mycena leptocephala]